MHLAAEDHPRCVQGVLVLPKTSQDSLLWSLQANTGSKKQWSIEGHAACYLSFLRFQTGHKLCREAWAKYMGIGKQRLQRCKRNFNGLDDRTIHRSSAVQRLSVGWVAKETPCGRLLPLLLPTTSLLTYMWQQRSLCL